MPFGFWDSKSLIKLTRSRIDVIRRKRQATQKFLKKDVADLLANGLDVNAYGRVSDSGPSCRRLDLEAMVVAR